MNIKLMALAKLTIEQALKYIQKDQSARYGLKNPVTLRIAGDGVGQFTYNSPHLKIEKNSDHVCTLTALPFAPETGLWNGPDILPDDLPDGTFEASLFHDLIWGQSAQIAEDNLTSPQAVETWANGIMIAIMKKYAQKPGGSSLWQRIVYNALQAGIVIYRPIKKLLEAFCVVILCLLFSSGGSCVAPPDWTVVDASGEVFLYKVGEAE